MPTLLELAEVAVPDGVDGISLRPGSGTRDHLHGEHVISALGRHSMQWIRSQRFKYVWFSGDGHEQLFDLEADPCEERDLAGVDDVAGELARHRELLVAELTDREEGFVEDGALVAGRPVQSEAAWVREFARL